MLECHVLFLMDLMFLKPFFLNFVALLSIFLGICAIFLHKKCVVLRKSACPFGQVQTEMYLPESRLVVMSNPVSFPKQVYLYNNTKNIIFSKKKKFCCSRPHKNIVRWVLILFNLYAAGGWSGQYKMMQKNCACPLLVQSSWCSAPRQKRHTVNSEKIVYFCVFFSI